MKRSTPIAKVTRPVSDGFYPRSRLFRLVDKARKAPILWICGPPGCGKTTLVSSYVEFRRLPCVWYQVDEGDVDPATFFYYLGLAVRKASPGKKRPLPLLTPDRLPGLSVFSRRYFEQAAARLASPSLMVFDSCEQVRDDASFLETLRDGITRLAPGINAVLVSRNDPHPVFARKKANRLLEVLGWKDLRLTLEEATGITRMRRKGRQAAALARDMHDRTDGWAAGLVLLLATDEVGGARLGDVRRALPEELFDYFGTEIIERQDAQVRSFLYRSALLPKMTAAMAKRLTGEARAGRILSDLNRRHYFTEMHMQPEPVYEYHALFREFLLGQADEALSRDDFDRLRKEASTILETHGYVEDAAGLFREAGDWDGLARLVLEQARVMIMQGRYRTLLEWIGGIPEGILEGEPWLLYWTGVCRAPFSPGESRACFEEAFREFDARGDAAGVFLAWSSVVESIFMEQEDYKRFDPWIVLLPRLLEKYGPFPSGEIEEQVTGSMFKALVQRRLPDIDIDGWGDRAMRIVRKTPDIGRKVDLGVTYLYYKLLLGRVHDAELILASLMEVLKEPSASPLAQLWVHWVEAVVSFFVANHERCLQIVSDAMAFAEESGVRVGEHLLVGYGSLAAMHVGDFETANRYLRRMEAALATMGGVPSSMYHLAAACYALSRRELGKAEYHSDEYLKKTDEMGHANPLPLAHVLAAHVHYALQESEQATGHLDRARRFGADIRLPWASWMCGLTEAYFHLCRNDEESALGPLGIGMRVGREQGLVGTTLWLPGFLETVAAKALEKEIEIEYVRELIRRNRLVPDPANADAERWPWPVKVYTLRRFGLLRDGKPVVFSRKVQQKPLQMLRVLISLGGRNVPEERITDAVWPDADGDLAHQSFSMTLTRLRRLLGSENVLSLREGRLTLDPRFCWVDAFAFESLLARVDAEMRGGAAFHGASAVRTAERAVALYGGTFLEGEAPFPWIEASRDRLRSKFLRAVGFLGDCLEREGRWAEAVACYRKGLEVDNLAEEFYRRLMICHRRLGQNAEALGVYDRCRRMLAASLGASPSPATEAILKSLS